MTVRPEIKDVILRTAQRVVERTSGELSTAEKRQLHESFDASIEGYEGRNPILGILGQWDAGADAGHIASVDTNAAIPAQRGQLNLGWDENLGTFRAPIAEQWSDAIRQSAEEAAQEYFHKASICFDEGKDEQATKHLCSAIICSIAAIAALMEWPYRDQHDDLNAIIALATGSWPAKGENIYRMLQAASQEGQDLNSAFAAAMGQPEAVRSGAYDDAGRTREEATMFAQNVVTLAERLGRKLR